MKLLYRPLSLVVSAVGALLSGAVFKQIWQQVAGRSEAPEATDHTFPAWKVVVAAAAQGAIVGAVKAAVDRAGAAGYQKATGAWPGKE